MVRRGARAGRPTLVVHVLMDGSDGGMDGRSDSPPPRAGLVVSRAVGGSVARNRVTRRLRHAVREQLRTVPAGSLVVVRALPQAATVGRALTDDLAGALAAALGRDRRRGGRHR